MWLWIFLIFAISILRFSVVASNPLDSILQKAGPTLCNFLTNGNLATRKLRNTCGEPKCSWDSWLDAIEGRNDSKPLKIVLSYAHNGFGNQLWQHTFAFMVAENLQAQLLVNPLPVELTPYHNIPPNTNEGIHCMEHLLPDTFEYPRLSPDSEIRKLCDNEPFYVSDRPFNMRNKTYMANFKQNLADIIKDDKPRCLKFVGYFQGTQPCREDAKKLWLRRISANFPIKPPPEDLVIYLRCIPRHYFFNSLKYYQTILSRVTYNNMWLITAPTCPKGIPSNNSNNPVHQVMHYLLTEHKAKKWNNLKPGDFKDMVTASMLHDLSALSSAKKLIIPVSSWGFWGGFLSSADEIHVNAPPHHQLQTSTDYIYHDQGANRYFGKWNGYQIVYDLTLTNDEKANIKISSNDNNNNKNNISYADIVRHFKFHKTRIQGTQNTNTNTNTNNNTDHNHHNHHHHHHRNDTNAQDTRKKKILIHHHGSPYGPRNGMHAFHKNNTYTHSNMMDAKKRKAFSHPHHQHNQKSNYDNTNMNTNDNSNSNSNSNSNNNNDDETKADMNHSSSNVSSFTFTKGTVTDESSKSGTSSVNNHSTAITTSNTNPTEDSGGT